MTSPERPIRVLELRSVWGTGGGPDKTILLGTERSDARRFAIQVCYLRAKEDPAYRLHEKAVGRVDYVEILERHSFDPRIWTELRRITREGRFDIVHAHDYKTDLLAWVLGKVEGVVPLATSHGWAGDSWKDRFYYAADRRLLAWYPMVIAVSTPIRETLIRHGAEPDRVKLIRNAIDPDVFRRHRDARAPARDRFGITPGEIAIGSVGRLESEKRFDLLLEAFAKVRDEHPQVKLLIAGAGSLESGLKGQVESLALAGQVTFLGHVDDVSTFHHALDLYVQSSEREGTPNAVLEAMALETPIVATAVGGTGDLVEDAVHALLVPSHDVSALADAILRAIREPEARRRRAAAARRRVEEQLSFDARMRAVEAVYEELVERKDAGRKSAADGNGRSGSRATADIEWAESRLQERFGSVRVLQMRPVASRLGVLHRIVATIDSADRTFYLKNYKPAASGVDIDQHLAHLTTLSEALVGAPGVLPYTVLAADATRGMILVDEVPGRPLASFHRSVICSPSARRDATAAWRGTGRWLGTLHRRTLRSSPSPTRATELATEISKRLDAWAHADPRHTSHADRAQGAVSLALSRLGSRPVATCLCHGDVSSRNIIFDGSSVGLIDLDDVRVDMPGIDVSLALVELDQFSRIASVLPIPGFGALALEAFTTGYGGPLPSGPEQWLPHFRVLAVLLLTLARQRLRGVSSRLATELRYSRAVADLLRTIDRVRDG